MSQILLETFTRADSNTIGNNWLELQDIAGHPEWTAVPRHFKIASNTLQAQVSTANLTSTVTNAIANSGQPTIPLTSGGGSYVAGDLVIIGRGTATVEYKTVLSSTSTSITFTTNLVNTQASGVTIIRQRYIPLLRQSSENVRDHQMILDVAALPAATQYLWSIYARWTSPGDHIRVDFTWASPFTYVIATIVHVINGTEVQASLTQFLASAGYATRWVVTVYGTNPTVVDIKPFRNVSGSYTSLVTSGAIKTVASSITSGSNSVVQSTGSYGLAVMTGSINGITGFTNYNAVAQTVPVNDTNIVKGFNPHTWVWNGSTWAQTQHTPSSIVATFTGTQFNFTQDTSIWQAGFTAGPVFKYSIDGGSWIYPAASSATQLTLANALVYGTHTIEIRWRVMPVGGTLDLWNGPATCQRITGFQLDTGEAFLDPGVPSDNALWYLDSLGQGPTAGDVDGNADPSASFAAGLSQALLARYGGVAFGGQGYGSAGVSNVPDLTQTWNFYSSGVPRTSGGLFIEQPTYIICQQSINDHLHATPSATYIANIQAMLTAWRAAAPSAKIIIFTAFQGNLSSIWTNMATAYANYQAATPDLNCYFLQLDPSVTRGFTSTRYDGNSAGTSGTADGTHPILSEEVPLIAYLSRAIFPALYPNIQKISTNNLSGGI
jgi:hypothetical protein